MDFRLLAYVRKNLIGKFSTREKCQQAKTNARWNDGCIYLFIYTLFNVDNLQLLLQKDKIAIHNIMYANSYELQ